MNVIKLKLKGSPAFQAVPGVPYLKLHVSSGVYYVRKKRAGKRPLFASTGETLKGRAKTRADDMIAEWLGEKRRQVVKNQVSDVIPDLLAKLAQDVENGDRRPATYALDQHVLRLVGRLFGQYFLDEIDEEFWETWVREKGRKLNRTLFDIAKYLSHLLTYAHQRKLIDRKPTIRNPDRPKKTGRTLANEEIQAILAHADERLRLQIILAYECGLRPGEVRCARWEWLRAEGNAVILSLPESFVKANAREIQLSPRAARELHGGIKTHRGPIFYGAKGEPEAKVIQNRRWRAACRAAGVKSARFYDLRHTFYNRTLLELGLPVQQVSAYGGTSIQTLQKVYLKPNAERTASVSLAISVTDGKGGFGVKSSRRIRASDENE